MSYLQGLRKWSHIQHQTTSFFVILATKEVDSTDINSVEFARYHAQCHRASIPLSKRYQCGLRLFHQNLKGPVQVLVSELLCSIPQHNCVGSRYVQLLILWPSLWVDNKVWPKIVLCDVAAASSCGSMYFFLTQTETQAPKLLEEAVTWKLSFIGAKSQWEISLTDSQKKEKFNFPH